MYEWNREYDLPQVITLLSPLAHKGANRTSTEKRDYKTSHQVMSEVMGGCVRVYACAQRMM